MKALNVKERPSTKTKERAKLIYTELDFNCRGMEQTGEAGDLTVVPSSMSAARRDCKYSVLYCVI